MSLHYDPYIDLPPARPEETHLPILVLPHAVEGHRKFMISCLKEAAIKMVRAGVSSARLDFVPAATAATVNWYGSEDIGPRIYLAARYRDAPVSPQKISKSKRNGELKRVGTPTYAGPEDVEKFHPVKNLKNGIVVLDWPVTKIILQTGNHPLPPLTI